MRIPCSVAAALLAFAPRAASGEEADFTAKIAAVDLLGSPAVVEGITACAGEIDPAPSRLDLEIAVDDQGQLQAIETAPGLGRETVDCLREVLSELSFPAVPNGFSLFHRFATAPAPDAPTPDQPAPETEPEGPPTARGDHTDPDASRIVYGQTGVPREQGVIDFTAHNLGYWVVEYGVSDNVAVGLKFLLPIGIVGFMPNLRLGFHPSEKLWLGASVNYTFLTPYIEDTAGEFYFMSYGGTLSLSAGSDAFMFNFAVTSQGVTIIQDGEETQNEGLFLPQLGVSFRLHERVKANLELSTPLVTDSEFMREEAGRWWLVMYGIRIHGERIYGDISFVWPAFEDAWEFMKYMPMGIPMLSFGFQFDAGEAHEETADGEGEEQSDPAAPAAAVTPAE